MRFLGFLFTKDTWQEVFQSLAKNKIRTIVTVLGVVWGIFLLVLLLGSARGFTNYFQKIFGQISTNSFVMWTDSTEKPFKGYQEGRRIRIKNKDIALLREHLQNVKVVVPRFRVYYQVDNGRKKGNFPILGDDSFFRLIQKPRMLYGRFINQRDTKYFRKVVVISNWVYTRLYDKGTNPVGKYLYIEGFAFKIIGVFKKYEASIGLGVHLPFTTFQKFANRGEHVDFFFVAGRSNADILKLQKQTETILKNIYKVHPDDKRAFQSFNIAREFSKMTRQVRGIEFLTWFVGIGTLIGGIFAIGSILLMTVNERTKEIGIRRAIGATPWMIKRQIILEALVLAVSSGLVGLIMGGLSLMLIDTIASAQGAEAFLLNPSISIPIVFIAIFILAFLGILIGLLPASRALKIKPIEALNQE